MKSIDITQEDNYTTHLRGDCDIECEFCREEEQRLNRQDPKKQTARKNEGKNTQ